jgi:hypothetical protein
MLTTKQKLAVALVLRMHKLAGHILDAADALESRINPQ